MQFACLLFVDNMPIFLLLTCLLLIMLQEVGDCRDPDEAHAF